MSDLPRPLCRVALLSGDDDWAANLARQLADAEAHARDSQQCYELAFTSLHLAEDLLRLAGSDGELQGVILDGATLPDVNALLLSLRGLRSELDLFVAISAGDGFDDHGVNLLDREDSRADVLLRRVNSAIGKRTRTPFADTLREYVEGARDAWHTPGHSSGDGLRESPWVADFYRLMGEHVFNADLSVSVQELDSLLEPSHVLQEAQDLAAEVFGARHTFFVTGGTSMANKVVVQHVLGNGGKMLVDQACHKSVHHAAILFGVDPVYLPASVNDRYGLYGPVAKQRIFAAMDANPDARLLVLTSSSYDGFYYDLAPIIAEAHRRDMRVLVDEAWYAHGHFHPDLRPCALECGADFVTQSTHKMLSAFSQASMVHVGEERFDEARFREHLNMHTSTSPQYGLIASLDVARKQMSMEGFARLSQCIEHARALREGIAGTGRFQVLSLEQMLPADLVGDAVRLDPLKLTIDVSEAHCSARQLQRILYERHAIQVEKVTHNTLSILVTLGTTQSKVLRLLSAFRSLASEEGGASDGHSHAPTLPALGEICQQPRSAYFGPTEQLSLSDAQHGINRDLIGRTSADQVVPYPPGIPVLVPGQKISEDVLEFLLDLLHHDADMELHGLLRGDGRSLLRVVSAS